MLIEPIRIPAHWGRVFGLDVDRGQLGAVWGAFDRATAVLYLYDEYRGLSTNLPVVADAILQRGSWIPGLIEMEGRKRTKAAGIALVTRLMDLRLQVMDAPTADPEAATAAVTEMVSSGRLRVFNTMQNWTSEYRQYERLPDGSLPEDGNLLMGATGLVALLGTSVAISENRAESDRLGFDEAAYDDTRNKSTGY